MARSGSVTRRIGRRRSDASPVRVAANGWPARMPSMSRAVVPELPQLRRDAGCEMREAWTVTLPPSRTEERSEEHTSELQSHSDLVCRLLLEKKKNKSTQE